MTELDRLARIELTQETMLRGLSQMNETLDLLRAMLEAVLKAATEPPPKSDLPETLRRIAAVLAEQQGTLTTLNDSLENLPVRIAEALESGRS